jgi:hypothetical protein
MKIKELTYVYVRMYIYSLPNFSKNKIPGLENLRDSNPIFSLNVTSFLLIHVT